MTYCELEIRAGQRGFVVSTKVPSENSSYGESAGTFYFSTAKDLVLWLEDQLPAMPKESEE